MKIRISIGLSSMLLIFLVLCMSVFCLLSISDAKTSLTYARKHADSVQAYYQADFEAQTFIRDYRKSLQNPTDTSKPVERDFPFGFGQSLHVELNADGSNIQTYYVYYTDDYVIDSDLPVWDGS